MVLKGRDRKMGSSKLFSHSFVTLFVVACIGQLSAGDSFSDGIERISLNAARSANVWFASGANETGVEIQVPASVPGGIYSDLEEHGLFSNAIYHEYNDMENRWVGRMNWTFSRNFSVTSNLLQKTDVVLVCDGLDTVSEVFINHVSVGRSDNMFVRYIFDIKSALKVGQNNIRVVFQSPVEYAQNQFKEHVENRGYEVVPRSLVPEYRGENQAQMIRKMQSAFSWDWGPSYPNSGIWKNIFIEGFNGAVIRDVMIFSTPSKPIPDETPDTKWNVIARVYYDAAANDETASLAFHRIGSIGVSNRVSLKKGKGNSVDVNLTESGSETKLWWPNGYGDQNLYWYNVSLASQSSSESSTRLLRIGFRTVELNEDFVNPQDQSLGREFYFIVNGHKMYSKGSNAIPLHVLPERITERQTEWLLRAAKMSHQNMIRVWGGGMYESEEFFDWADEYGIFIWEDFMFACAMYPANEEYLATVRQEVETQVKRLQYRTSLVMWAGNNENEAALRDNWYGSGWNFSIYYDDYIKLYIETIKVLTEELDPSRKFISSSPTNGKKTEEEGWVARYPYDLKYGDIHFYDYASDNWDWKMFRRTRYASEYGYQSFPHYETLSEVADDITKWTWNSPMMNHRQHHPKGQTEIRDLIRRHFPFPQNYDSTEAFPYMLYMAQLSQSMGQKTQTEFYRRLQDKLDSEGTGHNMGALYWQLNDIWEGCSWSSIEISGKWKLQMYYALKFFAPVLASPYLANGDVVVELISDLPRDFLGQLRIRIFKLGQLGTLLPEYDDYVPVRAKFLTSKEVARVNNTVLQRFGCSGAADTGTLSPCVVYLTLPGTPDNFLFLQYPKNKMSLKNPNLQITSVSGAGDGKTVRFSLTTQSVAPFVFLTVRGDHRGYFSDNGFLQVSNKELTYYSENGITAQQFMDRVQVMSLFNVTAVAENYVRPVVHSYRYLFADDTDYGRSDENDVHSSYLLYTDMF